MEPRRLSTIVKLTVVRVPKELISRFVKLCPTCQTRRGMNRNSPLERDRELPEVDAGIDVAGEVEAKANLKRESVMIAEEQGMLSMPMQLVSSSSTFQNQNRWMTEFHAPQEAYNSLCSMSTAGEVVCSFPAVNGFNRFQRDPTGESHPPSTSTNNVTSGPQQTQPDHTQELKQEVQFCYR